MSGVDPAQPTSPGDAAYIMGLTADFFTIIFGYLMALDIVMQQPLEASEPPAPR